MGNEKDNLLGKNIQHLREIHGETLSEPVTPGTNRAAVESEYVDMIKEISKGNQNEFNDLNTNVNNENTSGNVTH